MYLSTRELAPRSRCSRGVGGASSSSWEPPTHPHGLGRACKRKTGRLPPQPSIWPSPVLPWTGLGSRRQVKVRSHAKGTKNKGQDGSGEAGHWAGPARCPSGLMGGAGGGFLARSGQGFVARSTGGAASGWRGLVTSRLQKKQKPVSTSCQSLWLGEGQDEVMWGSLAHSEPRSCFSQILG